MKKRIVLTLTLLMSASSLLFSQEQKDTSIELSIYPQFSSSLSEEESWKLHKQAFQKQLESKGFSKEEVKVKMLDYEKQKQELIEQMKVQRQMAKEQRQLAEIQREIEKEQRKLAENQRKNAIELRTNSSVQRVKSDEVRRLAEVLREQTEELRKDADELRKIAIEHRKHAGELREAAEEHRKIAEELRKSIKSAHRETIQFQKNKSEEKAIKINVKEKTTLFFNIDGIVSSGKVMIQLFSPSGKNEGELSLEDKQSSTSKSESSINVSGSLNKTINTSEKGDWLIKITSEKSEGTINVSVAQLIKPSVND